MLWHYSTGGDATATAQDPELPALIAAGVIGPRTLVWKEGMGDWQPLGGVCPDLFQGQPPMPVGPMGSAVPVAPQTDSLAVTSLIFGITGILCLQVLAIPAVICGHIAYKRAKAQPMPYGNSSAGTALAGIITGYVGIFLLLLFLIYFLFIGAVFWNMFPAILEGGVEGGEFIIEPFDPDQPVEEPGETGE